MYLYCLIHYYNWFLELKSCIYQVFKHVLSTHHKFSSGYNKLVLLSTAFWNIFSASPRGTQSQKGQQCEPHTAAGMGDLTVSKKIEVLWWNEGQYSRYGLLIGIRRHVAEPDWSICWVLFQRNWIKSLIYWNDYLKSTNSYQKGLKAAVCLIKSNVLWSLLYLNDF